MDAAQRSQGIRHRLSGFFMAEEVPYGLALIRICLPLALLIAAIPRWPHARELYSLDGAPNPLWESYGYFGMLPIPSGPVAVALATLYILSLVTLSCGWMTRTSAVAALVLHVYLGMLDITGTLTKYTCVAAHVLLLLAVSRCGSLWSMDAWLADSTPRWPVATEGGRQRFPAWPRRLIQILVAVVYFAAAVTKMQTPNYFSGDQIYFWLLTNVNFANPVGEAMSLWPPMLVAMSLVTVVWEIVFPFVCWKGMPKAVALVIGAVFHLLTTLMLGLIVFPLVCLATYWAFFETEDIQGLARWLRRQQRRLRGRGSFAFHPRPARPAWLTPSLSGWAFAACGAFAVGAAIEVEESLDVYGMHRVEGPHELAPLDPEQAAAMLAGAPRVSYSDQLLGFDVGSQTIGGLLANSRDTFTHGEMAVIQCSVIPPHGDIWVEVNLHDSRDRRIERVGQVLTREKIRSHFTYTWTEAYPAGQYDLVLNLDGEEVARRTVTVGAPATGPQLRSTAMVR